MLAKDFAKILMKHPDLEVIFGDDEYDYSSGKPVLKTAILNDETLHKSFGYHRLCYCENEGTKVWVLESEKKSKFIGP